VTPAQAGRMRLIRFRIHRMVRKSLWLKSTATKSSRARGRDKRTAWVSMNSRHSLSSSWLAGRARTRAKALPMKVSRLPPRCFRELSGQQPRFL